MGGFSGDGEGVRYAGTHGETPAIPIGPVRLANISPDVLTRADSLVLADATAAPLVAVLPSAVGIRGRAFTVLKVDASANAVTVTPAGGETINGAATAALSAQWSGLTVTSDGANWVASAGTGSGGGGGAGNVTVVQAAQSPYTVLPTDGVLLLSAGANLVVNLPDSTAYGLGRSLLLIRLDFTTNTVTVNPNGSETINGAGSKIFPNPLGAEYGGTLLTAVGNDGIGFANGWVISFNTVSSYLEIGVSGLVPTANGLLKLGSALASFQPYTRGLYFSDNQTFVVTDSPVQLQSYFTASRFDTTGGPIVVNLNGAQGFGQLHMLRADGNVANPVTVNPLGADTINGAPSLTLTPTVAGQQAVMLVGFAGNWVTMGVA